MTAIQKYKTEQEMTMDELTECVSARRNGKPPPRFKRAEYIQAEREALEDAGLEPDEGDGQGSDGGEGEPLTVDQQFQRIRASDESGRS
jgi:hypothetical protein